MDYNYPTFKQEVTNMYSKVIKFQKYVRSIDTWVEQSLRVTDDSFWLHFQSMSLNKDIRSIVVSDL